MTTATVGDAKVERAPSFLQATIGKKVTMAVTGIVLFGFVVAHMLGNLQIYQGRAHMNAYAQFLHSKPALLWAARLVLLISLGLHVAFGVYLSKRSSDARPIRYRMTKATQASLSSRTMLWSGGLIFFFVVYHLLHLTLGVVHPSYDATDVYANVVRGFRVAPAAAAYIVAMLGLGLHLNHGAWSLLQTLGVNHPRYTPTLRRLASVAATVLVLGNVSIPVAILTGLVGS
jgi:succinate dehydrogenase / fumarate reductase cytochrome b subunit